LEFDLGDEFYVNDPIPAFDETDTFPNAPIYRAPIPTASEISGTESSNCQITQKLRYE
jgi:hypothetical protein